MKEKRYPVGWHPANEEEAVARIEAIEAEYERIGKATDFEEFIEELKAEGLWLSRFQEMADETERKYDISPKRDIKKDPRYRAMRTILERSNI